MVGNKSALEQFMELTFDLLFVGQSQSWDGIWTQTNLTVLAADNLVGSKMFLTNLVISMIFGGQLHSTQRPLPVIMPDFRVGPGKAEQEGGVL